MGATDHSWENTDQDYSLLPERELADRWHKSLRTLQRWRAAGYGPPHIRIGSSVLYRFPDVVAFEAARRSEEVTEQPVTVDSREGPQRGEGQR